MLVKVLQALLIVCAILFLTIVVMLLCAICFWTAQAIADASNRKGKKGKDDGD